MLSRARGDAGFTVVELLVASSLAVVVMLAVFSALNGFGSATATNFRQNQAQSIARRTIDRVSRDLRSLATPGSAQSPLERATADDLVFRTVNPLASGGGSNTWSVQRVRYCLDGSLQLWKQVQTWTTASAPSLPNPAACPHSSFGSQALVADNVVNEANGQNRPVFVYDAASAANVRSVTIQLYTDTSLTRPPGEQLLSTTVFLRNKNAAPTASFTAAPIGARHVLLNASASQDPDGDDLSYTWYDGSTQIGTGVLFDYAAQTLGNHDITVTVTDPAGLSTTSAVLTVNVT